MFQSNEPVLHATTIGKQMKITGTLASDGNLTFDGILEKGTIRIGGSLTVGPEAFIKGEVEAQKLIVNGAIEGNVMVKEDLEIGASGKISGDITVYGNLIVTKGGVFNGKCTMGQDSNTTATPEQTTGRRSVSREKREAVNE